jgi:hypothetical protein
MRTRPCRQTWRWRRTFRVSVDDIKSAGLALISDVTKPKYALASDATEIARLQRQAALIAEPTTLLLQRGGIRPGMRSRHVAAYMVAVVRAMKDAMVNSGVTSEEEIGLDTLEQRLGEPIMSANAVCSLPTVVGGWGRRPK